MDTSTFISDISGKRFPVSDRISGKSVRLSVMKFIQEKHPDFTDDSSLSFSELNDFRQQYVSVTINQGVDEVTELEKKVLESINDSTILTDEIGADDTDNAMSFGQRVADKVASFGGSWTFIIFFIMFIIVWMILNIILFMNKGFDPYPFILLNLLLSCLAALQAPVIMMSQNRQEDKDRDRAKKDYMINLKSEIEIRTLHEKIDHLILHQQQKLMEVQNIQIEMMEEILKKLDRKKTDGDTAL